MMKRFLAILIVLLLTNGSSPSNVSAQQLSQTPPSNPIVTPIEGQLAYNSTDGLIIVNTADASIQPVKEGGSDPVWDATGTLLASVNYNFSSTKVFNIQSSEATTLVPEAAARNVSLYERRMSAGWSADSQNMMYVTQIAGGDPISSTYRLDILNLQTNTVTTVLEILPGTMMNTLFPVPPDTQNVILDTIHSAQWNPVYTDWVFIQPIGYGKYTSTGEDMGVYEGGIFNYVTRQYISFETLFPQTVVNTTKWSDDGRKLAMTTLRNVSVIEFTVEGGKPKLKLLANEIDSREQAVLHWVGAGDLLISGTTFPYTTNFIAQIIDGEWYSQEFIAIASLQPPYTSGNSDFHLTAEGDERNQLSCMFFDQVYPPKLQPSQRGQVTFTDGTPSRLRDMPGTNGTVVTQMDEGTAFEVVGSAYCVDDYRWWQVRLEDGTTGWVAEGNSSEAWVEPLN
jgi:hypothetical protein